MTILAPKVSLKKRVGTAAQLVALVLAFLAVGAGSPPRGGRDDGEEPSEIRGYKVAHATVAVKRQTDNKAKDAGDDDSDAMVQVGDPRLVSVRPFGITFEIPITVSALDKGGTVDFLTFEDVKVNDSAVSIEEFQQKFEIPNKKPMELPAPVRVYISTPTAMLGALNEWRNSKETWPVSGRVYVFGRFKKFIFKVKRVVPIDFNLTIANPLRSAPEAGEDAKPASPAVKKN
jgi:hypothetical protein